MKLWQNVLMQLLNVGLSVVVPAFVHNPGTLTSIGKWAGVAAGIAGVVAHFYNPDGTKAN